MLLEVAFQVDTTGMSDYVATYRMRHSAHTKVAMPLEQNDNTVDMVTGAATQRLKHRS
jgi:hypothetical protein